MDTEQNNLHINSFTKGMNSDASYDKTPNELYVFGKNIRITNNTLIASSATSNTTEGIVTPVYEGLVLTVNNKLEHAVDILAVNTIGNIGAIVVKYTNAGWGEDDKDKWAVYKMEYKPEEDSVTLTHLFTSTKTTNKKLFSTVINNEIEGVTKLYIADGEHPVMQINIEDTEYIGKLKNGVNAKYEYEDMITSNRIFPSNKIQIVSKISGQLQTQQVQYTYRFYHKYGVVSQLAPLTSKILVIDASRNKEIGNAENTKTSIGFKLKINADEETLRPFDHVQVYRLSYLKPGQNAEINLIYDAKLKDGELTINDTGLESLQTLTIEEFAALSGQTLVPEVIESNQGYLFAASIKDESMVTIDHRIKEKFDAVAYQCNADGNYVLYNEEGNSKSYTDINDIEPGYTINKYVDINEGLHVENPCKYSKLNMYGGDGKNVSWRFVICDVDLHDDCLNSSIPITNGNVSSKSRMGILYKDTKVFYENIKTSLYFTDYSDLPKPDKLSYDDIFVSSKLRSLRRGEVYRYGIVLYTKYGTRSDVMWIADIRVPTLQEIGITKIDEFTKTLIAKSIGIRFAVTIPETIKQEYAIEGYEIVRCETSPEFSSILTQCVVSRPVRLRIGDKWTPYYPTGILSSQFIAIASGFGNKITYREEDGLLKTDIGVFDGLHQSKRVDGVWSSEKYDSYASHLFGYFVDPEGLENNGFNADQRFEKGVLYNELDATRSNVTFPFAKQGSVAVPYSWNVLQLYNAEMLFYRNDLENLLLSNSISMHPELMLSSGTFVNYQKLLLQPVNSVDLYCMFKSFLNTGAYNENYFSNYEGWKPVYDGTFILHRNALKRVDKTESQSIYTYYNQHPVVEEKIEIASISDVKNATWENAFSKVNPNGDQVSDAIAQYKSYITALGGIMYNNWVSSGVYGMRSSLSDNVINTGDDRYDISSLYFSIGPGPQCFIANTNTPFDPSTESNKSFQPGKKTTTETAFGGEYIFPALRSHDNNTQDLIYTHLCNIKHTATQFAGILESQKQYDTYYGFGNYTNLAKSGETPNYVFDGTIYIVPCEIQTMFKAYDFNYPGNLYSNLIINYVPMETTVNTYFDYGMNYRNTSSANLQLKPGDIEGVASQERPLHSYNDIYSDNSTSNNVFVGETIEQSVDKFTQRIVYSQHKTIGEFIDSWGTFKPADFIDADGRYGQITDLYTMHDTLFMWQEQAFGKLSVNERSLVKDENSNTIQLGTGDVLQRVDYLSTRYGMRKEDFAVNDAANVLYWIDVQNKALAAYSEGVINIAEQTNVLNILNQNINTDTKYIPTVHTDLQNDEILFKCLKGGDLMVYNYKYRMFTSVYSRTYDNIADFKNVLCGICPNTSMTAYNYCERKESMSFLAPQQISFIVNPSSTITKVFDNLKLVTLKRDYSENWVKTYFSLINYDFITDLNQSETLSNVDAITNREGNILYTIPRIGHDMYGSRLRGKWMKVDMTITKPSENFAISTIITKFRQSFS